MKFLKYLDKTALKFILVGVINTIVGTATMFLMYNLLHASYWVSSASNYIVGSIVSYFLNKYYTFQSKDNSLGSIVRFVVNISICYLIAYGVAKPVAAWIFSAFSQTVRDNMAMLAGMGLFVVLNYIGQRFFVFKAKEEKPDAGENGD